MPAPPKIRPVEWRLGVVMHRRAAGPRSVAARLTRAGLPISAAQISRLSTRPPRRVTLELIAGLCEVLGCTIGDLVRLADPAPPRRSCSAPPEVHLP